MAEFFKELDLLETGHDADGHPLAKDADGTIWTCCMVFGLCDLLQGVEWGLPDYNKEALCSFCLANRSDRPFTNLQRGAEWRPTEDFSEMEFQSRLHGVHPLRHSRYMTRLFVRGDIMHIMDHHGFTGQVAASVIIHLVRTEARHDRVQAVRLAEINQLLNAFNSDFPASSYLKDLSMANLLLDGTLGSWAELHGPTVKAASTRHLAPFINRLAVQYCDSGSDFDVSVLEVAGNLCKMYDIMYTAGRFLTERQHSELTEACYKLGYHYQRLRGLCDACGWLYFQIKPKTHMTMHVPFFGKLINPRWVQCYCSESMIGVVTQIWEGSVSGPYHNTVQRTVLLKYLVQLAICLDW
jgi:hypothetical protein